MIAKIYLIWVLAMSVVAILAFGIDKRRAVVGKTRISEKALHSIALFGGWPGSLIGQRLFRHKTVKLSFRLVLWSIVGIHLCGILLWIFGGDNLQGIWIG